MLGAAFVLATVGVTLGCYFAMRWLTGGDPDAKTRDLASSVIFRISALHGLILARVFAQEMVEYQQLKLENATEANAIADIYFDADRYGSESEAIIQNALFDYTNRVIDSQWGILGRTGLLDEQAWALWDTAYKATLDLNPSTPRQTSVRENMLRQIHDISATRVERGNHAANPISAMFWFAAVAGMVMMSLAYYSFPPERYNLVLIAMFGAFTGLILYFIYAFTNPFSEPGAMVPSAHLRLIEQLQFARASGGQDR